MIKFKKGDKVRQSIPLVQGVIVEQHIIDDEVQYIVEFKRGKELLRTQMKESEIEADE